MERVSTHLRELQINEKIVSVLERTGIAELFPPQEMALTSGVLEGRNLILAVPTSAGKTLVAEICMLKSIVRNLGKALYLVPLKSLAREKYNEFKKYAELGLSVAMSVGDYDSPGQKLGDADIIILTTERADSLIRHQATWLYDVSILVVDEIHLINDETRGPTLEMVIAKIRQIVRNIQIIGLSATISNSDDIAQWLDSGLVKSTWRPVPLIEGVFLNGRIKFNDGTSRPVRRKRDLELADIAADTLEEGGQVLIFVSSRRSTIAVANKLASMARSFVDGNALKALQLTAKRIAKRESAPEVTKVLAHLVQQGIAFHHAGLTNTERGIIEDCFKENLLKLIVTTPTLAAGVNLPARRAIIRDYRRFEFGKGSYPIPILEYKQMAGRAGRPKYDDYGEAVLIAKTFEESEDLYDNYILSEPESIESRLDSEQALCSHILSTISAGMTRNRSEIDELVDGTFFAFQFRRSSIDDYITRVIDFLHENDLICLGENNELTATLLGHKTSKLYITPETAVLFRDTLESAETVSTLGILHLICHSSNQPTAYVRSSEYHEYESILIEKEEELLVPYLNNYDDFESYSRYLAELKTALLIKDWISERSEHHLTESYGVGMGDVHRYVQSAEWLVYAVSEIARVISKHDLLPQLHSIKARIKHGVKEQLLELVSLKGIGRVRGRMLFNHGYTSLSKVYSASLQDIAAVPSIGTSVAESIKRQMGQLVNTPSETRIEKSDSNNSTTATQTLLDDFH